MPKEYIESCEGPFDGAPFAVRVGWSREAEYVQIATIDPEGETLSDSGGKNEVKVEGGNFVDLDRRRINDLIRLLRRARDQAFGRDE